MRRREFVSLAAGTSGLVAGCTSLSDSDTESASTGPQTSSTGTESSTPRENPDTIFVDPAGEDTNSGTQARPIRTIQEGLDRVEPGQTLHVLPGRYLKPVQTTRGGTPDAPITITGPPDAKFNAYGPFEINHSHVHIRGLTFDGLYQPDSPEDPNAYSESILQVNESFYERIKSGAHSPESVSKENYLRDVVIKPHAVGNCRADVIKVHWSKNVEIGEFEVIGPAGVKYLKGNADSHNGEIVYLGNSPNKGYPMDRTHDVHVHHIDASGGHGHAELVDLKPGTHHCLVEYCTSAGGGLVGDETTPTVISHNGHHNVVRWNELYDCAIGVEFDADYPDWSYENDLYGNYIHDVTDSALAFEDRKTVGLNSQGYVCGNTIEGSTEPSLTDECPETVPEAEQVGHTGGESSPS